MKESIGPIQWLIILIAACFLSGVVGFTFGLHQMIKRADDYATIYQECMKRSGILSEELRICTINLRNCERYVERLKDER